MGDKLVYHFVSYLSTIYQCNLYVILCRVIVFVSIVRVSCISLSYDFEQLANRFLVMKLLVWTFRRLRVD